MLFALYCLDYPDKDDLRLATRAAHQDYIAASGAMVKTAGPLITDDGEMMIGSLFVIEARDRAEVERWSRNDPYIKAGLFERVEIKAFRWIYGAPSGLAGTP